MPLKILVVDDEASNMLILAISLRHRGHLVLEASCPEQALEMARRERPDVVLMDLMFHQASMDGIEAIRRLKADRRTADIPVVAHTASVLDYSELTALGAGAEGFIRKPFRRQELLAVIEQVMGLMPVTLVP